MKKIVCMLVAVLVVVSMTVPVYAVTPTLNIPDVPQISNIKIEVKLDEKIYENAVQKWFAEHPLNIDFSQIKLPIWFGG